MAKEKLYANGMPQHIIKKVAQFFFKQHFIIIKRDDLRKTFTVIVAKDVTNSDIIYFKKFWQVEVMQAG